MKPIPRPYKARRRGYEAGDCMKGIRGYTRTSSPAIIFTPMITLRALSTRVNSHYKFESISDAVGSERQYCKYVLEELLKWLRESFRNDAMVKNKKKISSVYTNKFSAIITEKFAILKRNSSKFLDLKPLPQVSFVTSHLPLNRITR